MIGEKLANDSTPEYTDEELRVIKAIAEIFELGEVPITHLSPNGEEQTTIVDLSQFRSPKNPN